MKKETPNYIYQVHEVTRQIPRGRVTTYGTIANLLALGSARMVGWALHQSTDSEKPIPAHRVVNHKGELSGRLNFATPTLMQQLLEKEGIKVVNNRIQDFDQHYWNPAQEI